MPIVIFWLCVLAYYHLLENKKLNMQNFTFRDTELDTTKELRNSLQGIYGVG